jgi:hypothetical protein
LEVIKHRAAPVGVNVAYLLGAVFRWWHQRNSKLGPNVEESDNQKPDLADPGKVVPERKFGHAKGNKRTHEASALFGKA